MIYILEGPDGVGKTTLAKKIKDIEGKKVFYMHLRVHKNMRLWHTASARLAIKKHKEDRLVIIDRHWPSEQCYSYIFRRGPSYDPIDIYHWLKKAGTKYIWCLPSKIDQIRENHINNRQIRHEEYYNIDKVIDLYFNHWFGLKTKYCNFLASLAPLYRRPDFIRYDMLTHGKDIKKWISATLI